MNKLLKKINFSINNYVTYPFSIWNKIDFLESIWISSIFFKWKFVWKFWKINVTLRVLDFFWTKVTYYTQDRIFRVIVLTVELFFFQKWYFEKHKKKLKIHTDCEKSINSFEIWQKGKVIRLLTGQLFCLRICK